MSYNGSGVFNINTAGQPVVTGTTISATVFNTLTSDLASGLSTAICKDGQTTITNNIPMNSFKFTGLAAGTAATDSVRFGQLQAGSEKVVTVTGTDTYTGAMTPTLLAYVTGSQYSFIVPNTNTAAATLNIDSLGAKALTRDGSTALAAGDLVSGTEVIVIYDGTRFQVINTNSKTNWTVSNSLTLSAGTANQVQYLNASKIATGSANLTFDGTTLTAAALSGPFNGTVGATTPNTGAFTTLSASSTVSGAGFSTWLSTSLTTPPAIGGTTPAAGAFTTLSASSTVSGSGFSTYLASPPAIGTTAPAGGRFTFAHTAPVAVTFSATAMAVDCSLANVFTTTFTANVTVAPTFSNLKDGQTINWFITQDGTGSRTMTWPTSFKWAGGVAGSLSTAANSVDLLVATYRSATGFWYASLSKGFA